MVKTTTSYLWKRLSTSETSVFEMNENMYVEKKIGPLYKYIWKKQTFICHIPTKWADVTSPTKVCENQWQKGIAQSLLTQMVKQDLYLVRMLDGSRMQILRDYHHEMNYV